MLTPTSVWYGDHILTSVRAFANKEAVPTKVRDKTIERREVISVSPFKRTLYQYKDFEEVARAIADIYSGGLLICVSPLLAHCSCCLYSDQLAGNLGLCPPGYQ